MREIFEAEVEGKMATCWISMGDLHAEFYDGTYKIYRNMKINGIDFDFPKDLVKKEIVLNIIPEELR